MNTKTWHITYMLQLKVCNYWVQLRAFPDLISPETIVRRNGNLKKKLVLTKTNRQLSMNWSGCELWCKTRVSTCRQRSHAERFPSSVEQMSPVCANVWVENYGYIFGAEAVDIVLSAGKHRELRLERNFVLVDRKISTEDEIQNIFRVIRDNFHTWRCKVARDIAWQELCAFLQNRARSFQHFHPAENFHARAERKHSHGKSPATVAQPDKIFLRCQWTGRSKPDSSPVSA